MSKHAAAEAAAACPRLLLCGRRKVDKDGWAGLGWAGSHTKDGMGDGGGGEGAKGEG
jgi:hypothetical protein